MGSSEKFCLRWNDFETNISVAFRELREEKDFFDVTLACDDSQVQAHKVILSACSPFFRSILRRNPHQHPLLYLKGVKYKELLSVLNFMYMGEVNVAQEELNSFLAVAEDLRVKGLTQNNAESSDKAKAEPSKASTNRAREPPDREAGAPPAKRPRPVAPSPITPVQQNNRQSNYKDDDDDIQEVVPVKSEPRDPSTPSTAMAPVETAAATSNEYQVDPGEGQVALDDQYQDDSYDYGEYAEGYDDGSGMIDPNTGMPMAGGADGNKDHQADRSEMVVSLSPPHTSAFVAPRLEFSSEQTEEFIYSKMERVATGEWCCTLCQHTSKQKNHVAEHIESKHIDNHPGYQCVICHKVCVSRNAYRTHMSKLHRKLKDDSA